MPYRFRKANQRGVIGPYSSINVLRIVFQFDLCQWKECRCRRGCQRDVDHTQLVVSLQFSFSMIKLEHPVCAMRKVVSGNTEEAVTVTHLSVLKHPLQSTPQRLI